MPDIKDSVGDGGKNNVHDVAMVQAMLRVIKNAKGKAYLGVPYDGAYGAATKTAITDFQTDHGLIAAGAAKPALPDTAGLVAAKSTTWAALVAALPGDYASMTIIEGTKTVYLEGSAGHRDAGVKAMHTEGKLDPTFRARVADGIKTVYDTHKLALWAGALGRHRTFADQFNAEGDAAVQVEPVDVRAQHAAALHALAPSVDHAGHARREGAARPGALP